MLNKVLSEFFTHLPKKWKLIVSFFILVIVLIVFLWKYNFFDSKKSDTTCELITLKGVLVNESKNEKISGIKVQLVNTSVLVESFTTPDGSFILEGIKIPNSRSITLALSVNNKLILAKDIDLSNTSKYSISDFCVLDLNMVFVNIDSGNEIKGKLFNKEKNSSPESKQTVSEKRFKNFPTDIVDDKSSILTISVLPFVAISNEININWITNGVSETITSCLVKSNKYKLIEILQRESLLKEIDFQQSKYVLVTSAVEIGKMLGVKFLIIGSCQIAGSKIVFNSRVVNVESGVIVKNSTLEYQSNLDDGLNAQKEFSYLVCKNLDNI